MGIKQLAQLVSNTCPQAITTNELKNFFSRKIAIDANMSMYQFLIGLKGSQGGELTNANGQVTSHLQGLLARTTKFVELGIKPIYIFDGKPPEMKSSELKKRREKAQQAQEQFALAEQEGDEEKMIMFSKRTIRVNQDQIAEGKRLLTLMGIPVVESPSESESQCAALAKHGIVYATATEDMDALTFGTPTLVRHMSFSESRKQPIQIFDLATILKGWDVTMDQFIDICILCGCDYCDTIRGVGSKKAHALVKKHGNIEGVIKSLKGKPAYVVPENFMEQVEKTRELFKKPDVTPGDDPKFANLKWEEPNEPELIEFLVEEKGFGEERVKAYIDRLKSVKGKAQQERLDSFFTIKKGRGKIEKKEDKKGSKATGKRKRETGSATPNKKKKN